MTTEAHAFGDIPSQILPRILRGAGAAVVVAALSLFLFQQWGSGDDVQRYLLLLGQTLVLTASGFACVRWLKEPKGARTFLALAVAAVPVNFTILGALVHSAWFGVPGNLPTALAWQAGDTAAVAAAALVSLPLLVVISGFGFLVLARRSALPLALLFLSVNALLLLPSRDGSFIGILVAGSLALLLLGLRYLRDDASLRTLEGRIARTMLFAAPAILLGRNLWLHDFGNFLFLATAGGLFLIFRAVSMELPKNLWRRWLEAISALPAAMAGIGAGQLASQVTGDPALISTAGALTAAAMIVEIGRRSAGGGKAYRLIAAVVAIGSSLGHLMYSDGPVTGVIALAVGLAAMVYGYRGRQLSVVLLGAVAALAGLGYQTLELVRYFDLGGWSGLALLGIGAIIAGSLLERHGQWLKSRGAIWRSRFSGQDA